MSDKDIFTGALYETAQKYLPNNPASDINQTSQDLVNYFMDNFKKTGLKRIGKGIIATTAFALGDYIFGNEGYSTLETICKIGAVGSAFYSISAARALISAYWNKNFLSEIARPIVQRYYFVDKYKNE